jgi:hypothetical protein
MHGVSFFLLFAWSCAGQIIPFASSLLIILKTIQFLPPINLGETHRDHIGT